MKYFKEKEFVCRCCGELPPFAKENIVALVHEVLDPAREKLGKPIVVNSGYRCQRHNKEVGGATGSQHLQGQAADVRSQGSSTSEAAARPLVACYQRDARKPSAGFRVQDLAKAIIENGKFDQLILYPTFVHVSWKRNGSNRHQILRKVGNGYQPVSRKEVLAL